LRLSALSLVITTLLLITAAFGPLAEFHSPTQGSTPSQATSSADFTLSLKPTNLTLVRGTSGFSNLTVTAVSGFQGTIALSAAVSLNATGVKASLSNSSVNFTKSGPTTILVLLKVSTTITGNPEVFYNITVTGTSSSLSHSAILTLVLPFADIPPVASFTFMPTNPLPKQNVTFNPAGSFDPDGIIVRYNWTFSDFTTIITLNNTSVHHAFAATGSYNVILTVTDNANLRGFAFATVTVGTVTGGLPIARFTLTPNNPIVGQGVFFDASTSSDSNGTIVNYLWNFGDTVSQTSFIPTIDHVYLIPGTVTVTLTVFDSFGRTASTSVQVQVASDPTSFLAALRLKFGQNRTATSVIDVAHGFAYFGLYTSPGIIVKVRLSNFTEVASLTLASGENYLSSAAIDSANGVAYFGTGTFPGIIVKINLSTFTQVGSIPLNPGEDVVYTTLIDNLHGSAYFGTGGFPSKIIKIRLSDFTRNATLAMPTGQTQLESGVIDPAAGYAYFGTFTAPGIIVKIRLSDFTEVGSLSLSQGQDYLSTATIDTGAGFAYFAALPPAGTQQSFATIIRVNLSNFTLSGSLPLYAGEFFPTAAMIDPSGGFSYFVILGYNGGDVIRIQLSSFTRQRTVNLLPGEQSPETAVLDPAAGSIYIGTVDSPALIVKLNTAAFNLKPTANFTFSPTNPTTGQLVNFDASSSTDPGGFIISYRWTFGDGSTSTFGPFTQHSYSSPGSYTVTLTIVDNGNLSSVATQTITVSAPDIPPTAQFTFSPLNPTAGTLVSFDGSQSRDPDGFIISYVWSFGDNATLFGGSFAQHTYFTAGNYTITLTVTDNAGLRGTASARITVSPRLQHDVAVTGVFPNFNTAIQTQTVGVTVNLADYGSQNENVTVSIFFNSTLVATRTNVPVLLNSFYGNQIFIQFDTSNIPPGSYAVSATAFLATDQNLSNNSLKDGQITILPAPKLITTPTSGSLGTKVVVQGSGFPTNQYGYPDQIIITFDDMFEGFTTTTTGSFNFTIDIPHAEPGIHLVKAYDSTNVHASMSFTVLAEPGSVAIAITVGAVYFPGDTADIYALTTVNGVPVGPTGVTVSLAATLPNGTTLFLIMSSVSPGLFKASFTVPNQLGTYALVAQASTSSSHASALASFEVKPSWLKTQAPMILSIAGVGAVIGLVALAWRTGYLRKDHES
jgi:PKD repeat protein